MTEQTMRTLLPAVLAIILLPAIATADLLESAPYRRAFVQMAESTFTEVFATDPETKGLSADQLKQKARATAEAFAECHMIAMSAYSDDLQNVAYRTILEGGSYADAESAFESALSAVLEAEDGSSEAAIAMMRQSIEIGGACAEQVKNDL